MTPMNEQTFRDIVAAEKATGVRVELRSESRIVELRDAEMSGFNFRGVAAVFDAPWNDELTKRLGYVESVARGTFRKALGASDNVPLLGAHRRHELLASTKGGTMKVSETGNGLEVEADLPDNYLGEYYRTMIERGDIKGMSYGIETAPSDSIFTKKNGVVHRSIANARRMLDVTLTWEPAYPDTVAELRDMGFAALSLQELTGGPEEQTGEAAAEVSSRVVIPQGRFSEFELAQMAKGGWPV